MMTIEQIEERRREILQDMGSIRAMNSATLKEQMLRVVHRGQKEPVLCGPYYVEAKWNPQLKKTQSRRVPRQEVEQVRHEVENHQRFVALCAEFVSLTEQLGRLERTQASEDEAVKKKPRRPSRRIAR